jgi:hypothetical protein
MKYLLRKVMWDKVPEIEITATEYAAFERARSVLTNALTIEQKYEIIITNYLAFEKEILDATALAMIREPLDYSDAFEIQLRLNIGLANLLTAARLYEDSLSQNVRECIPDAPDAEYNVKGLFSKEYNENKEYRFMKALRNYVQHRGMPIHLTEHESRWTSLNDDSFLEYRMELASERRYLGEDPIFKEKKRFFAELDEKIDLKAATRSYVESISNVHESVRTVIAETVSRAKELIEDAHRQYAAVYNGTLVGLSACQLTDDGQVSVIPILLDWDNIRMKLQQRNRKLINLRKRYVTGAIKIS